MCVYVWIARERLCDDEVVYMCVDARLDGDVGKAACGCCASTLFSSIVCQDGRVASNESDCC